MANVIFCVTFLFLSEIRFLSHNFGYRYARKAIKGCKDADHSLVSKKILSQKTARWVGTQGKIKLAKIQKHRHRELQTQNWKKNLQPKLEDFLNPWRVWTAL